MASWLLGNRDNWPRSVNLLPAASLRVRTWEESGWEYWLYWVYVWHLLLYCEASHNEINYLLNSLAPERYGSNFKCVISKHACYWWSSCALLVKCFQVNARECLRWEIKVGSSNGLVPSGSKPLPETILTQIYVAICSVWSRVWKQPTIGRVKCEVFWEVKTWSIYLSIYWIVVLFTNGLYFGAG